MLYLSSCNGLKPSLLPYFILNLLILGLLFFSFKLSIPISLPFRKTIPFRKTLPFLTHSFYSKNYHLFLSLEIVFLFPLLETIPYSTSIFSHETTSLFKGKNTWFHGKRWKKNIYFFFPLSLILEAMRSNLLPNQALLILYGKTQSTWLASYRRTGKFTPR